MVKKRIVCIDFKQLNPDDFIYEGSKDIFYKHSMILQKTGILYINTRTEGWKLNKKIFNILKDEETETLKKFIEWAKKEYPHIKSMEYALECKGNKQIHAISMFLAPVELKRRELEVMYGKP